jgi:hypothetical protein
MRTLPEATRKRLSPGLALAHHDAPRTHEAAVETVRDAAEQVVLEIGEERARERRAARSFGPVPEAAQEGHSTAAAWA